ncbi:putative indole-3-pyruvate monooxygenase YUCCA10 [Colletotrichum shisoi]|uniref:Putative indole-3-pyruvate monooxygenase YUCCA10 n=1 Tax=Colletotrichum shisoi TaxID=2078593 RepID=A0A5Q4BMJ9_9PEZI|nr:putative indole-3-pyruvate monooxygenase YUCCA10 [Colletotrichum shisoi]
MAENNYIITLPALREAPTKSPEMARDIVAGWTSQFEQTLSGQKDKLDLTPVFRQDAWVRDFLGLSWDFRTINGLDEISAYFAENSRARAFTLVEMKGFEEKAGINRPTGHVDDLGKGNWREQRERQMEFLDEEPAVLIIGAGHAGINLGVRLRHLGIPTSMVDRNEHVGDSWRKRYRTLMTHDPIRHCHLPFIPFPADWPLFTPKDKLADLARVDLDRQAPPPHARRRQQHPRHPPASRRPRHGSGRRPPIAPSFPGQDGFRGAVYHGSQHSDASSIADLAGKRVLVVGSGNSSHDICQNFRDSGAASATMIQRGGTYVVTANKGLLLMHEGMYDEGGPPTDDADIVAQSMPTPVQFALHSLGTKFIADTVDRDLLAGLGKAGFELDFGPGGSGIFRKYLTRGGGYYIDIGCSQLIADGKVKVHHSPDGISGFTPTGLTLADGTTLEADIVVLATGYDGMRSSARKILGDAVADRVRDCWDLDEQGEINSVGVPLLGHSIWRSSGHPGFWYTGGNLALCRSYS